MKIVVSENQINRIIKKYLDGVFEKSYFGNFKDDSNEWEGFLINSDGPEGYTTIVGRPVWDDHWYSNGHYFMGMWDIFGLSPVEFNEILSSYIRDRYNIEMGVIL